MRASIQFGHWGNASYHCLHQDQNLGKNVHINYETFTDAAELPADERDLLESALQATAGAYVPFSQFHVGCALLLEDGEVITGNNQENVAFPSSLCAERTALYYCGSQGKAGQILKLAIRAKSERTSIDRPVTPCGACRQVMLEYERQTDREFVVLMQGETGEILRIKGVAATLLPFSFDLEF